MNDIRRLRLQNQIFRHVATYYQKMARGAGRSMLGLAQDIRSSGGPSEGQDVAGLAQDTRSFGAPSEGQDDNTTPVAKSPFDYAEAAKFTEQVADYCTFTRCELSSDGSFAKIFVSIWGDAKEQERIFNDIRRQAHGMRSSIAKHIRMRVIPQLAFVQDHSFERASEIDKLI